MRSLSLFLVVLPFLVLAGCGEESGDSLSADEAEARLDLPVDYTDIKVGEGEAVGKDYLVMIEYSGRVEGADVPFDQNDVRDEHGVPTKPPYKFKIGHPGVIPGLDEGVRGMKKGGTRKMQIPWQKAYGLKGTPDGKIGRKKNLEFTVTLLDFVAPGRENEFDWEDVKVGTGAVVKEGSTVTAHYKGTFVNGNLFDDSRQRGTGGTPVTFEVGAFDAIPGVDHGVRGMRAGGVRRITIPPLLAYGDYGYQTMQGGQIVVIEIEVLKVE